MFMTVRFIQRYFFQPLQKMQDQVKAIRSGNLAVEVKYDGTDEFGEIYSEVNLMRIRMRAQMQRQQDNDKRRSRLMASISHDLRTPLTSIQGYVEGLQDGIVKDKETYDRYLETILIKTEALNHLIDDLSVFAKQELGEFSLNKDRINSGALLNSYFKQKESEFALSNVNLILERPFVSTFIEVDRYRFVQILENLMSNAKKYTDTTVRVYTSVKDYQLQIFIEDDGHGIPQSSIPHLFDYFYMVNKKKDQKEKMGSGLGLAICKNLITAHKGDISVTSSEGNGSTFMISIPIDL